MKKKLILVILCALILTVAIYYLFSKNNKIYYIALGDGIALGENPYGTYGYGYPDYFRDYIVSKEKLAFFTKNFAKNDLRISDLINQINTNYTIEVKGKKLSINQALVKANLITLSIGNVDLFYHLKINNNYYSITDIEIAYKRVNDIFVDLKKCIALIRDKYKRRLIIIGFYNPLTNNEYINNEVLKEIFDYTDNQFKYLAKKYRFQYIKVNEYLGNNKSVLPNPNSIHISYNGYKIISDLIIKRVRL